VDLWFHFLTSLSLGLYRFTSKGFSEPAISVLDSFSSLKLWLNQSRMRRCRLLQR
jgi:hypothetical protein